MYGFATCMQTGTAGCGCGGYTDHRDAAAAISKHRHANEEQGRRSLISWNPEIICYEEGKDGAGCGSASSKHEASAAAATAPVR